MKTPLAQPITCVRVMGQGTLVVVVKVPRVHDHPTVKPPKKRVPKNNMF